MCGELGSTVGDDLSWNPVEAEIFAVMDVHDALCIDIGCCWNSVDLLAIMINIHNDGIKFADSG